MFFEKRCYRLKPLGFLFMLKKIVRLMYELFKHFQLDERISPMG